MKLRNRKYKEVIEACIYTDNDDIELSDDTNDKQYTFKTLKELCDAFEDYTPQEPLIKDEKIRETLRAWAEINNITMVAYDAAWNAFRRHDYSICFDYDFDIKDNFEDNEIYTIAELCG